MMGFGDRPCFFNSLTSNRLAALGIAARLNDLVENVGGSYNRLSSSSSAPKYRSTIKLQTT